MYRYGLALALMVLLGACSSNQGDYHSDVEALTPEALAEHGKEFREDVIEVTEGVYVAIGFGIANSIMIEGEDAVTIVDTMESMEAATRIAERFREITDKPVEAIIYTHSHPDHIHGSPAFVDDEDAVVIYAHDSLEAAIDQTVSVLQPILTQRSFRMFGTRLPDEDRTNVGIGPFVDLQPDSTLRILRPTHTFSDEKTIEVGGVTMVLKYAPGETDDQVVVWLPDQEVLLPGDNFYRAFPNLYTIRGTSYRDPKTWADSLEMMRDLEPAYLVPAHSRPIEGKDTIRQHLTDYRDAIRYVYDQTIRMMNEGMTADEIAHAIELPPHLAASPFLQEFYGKPEWSARMIFGGQLGWFDGNPTNLHPTAPDEKAQRMADLAGGEAALKEQAQAAAADDSPQWVLELTDHLLRLDAGDNEVRQLRIDALRTLAAQEVNPNARHYYLTSAAELAGEVRLPHLAVRPQDSMLDNMPIEIFFNGMSVGLDGRDAWDIRQQVIFEFPDLDESYTLIVRQGATELRREAVDDPDVHVRIDSLDFKRMLAGLRNPAIAVLRDFDYVEGGRVEFARFMMMFDPGLESE